MWWRRRWRRKVCSERLVGHSWRRLAGEQLHTVAVDDVAHVWSARAEDIQAEATEEIHQLPIRRSPIPLLSRPRTTRRHFHSNAKTRRRATHIRVARERVVLKALAGYVLSDPQITRRQRPRLERRARHQARPHSDGSAVSAVAGGAVHVQAPT